MPDDISIRIGGDAGQGVESTGAGFCKALTRSGLHLFAATDYRSRIRGGHNFYQVRAGTRPVFAQRSPSDLLVAMTPETIDVHVDQLAPGAGLISDESLRLQARLEYRMGAERLREREPPSSAWRRTPPSPRPGARPRHAAEQWSDGTPTMA